MKRMFLVMIFAVNIIVAPCSQAAAPERFDAALAFVWLFSLGNAANSDTFNPEKMRAAGNYFGLLLGTSDTGVTSAGSSLVDPDFGQLTYSYMGGSGYKKELGIGAGANKNRCIRYKY